MFDFDEVIDRRDTNCVKWDGWKTMDKPKDVIPLWVADMDFRTPKEVSEAIASRAKHDIYGYTMADKGYYEAVAGWMKRRHDLDVKLDDIITTTGVVTALKLAVNAFTRPGDAIMINKPVYYPFDFSIDENRRPKIECPMAFVDDHYELDYTLFEQKIVANNVKMYILCNPYNPIGKVWTRDELQKIGDICKKHHVIVVSDEIHQDFVYEGHKHIPFVNVDETFKEFTMICTAPSKTFNLAGLQTSNILFFNDKLKNRFVEVKSALGFPGEPNIFGLEACKAAYTHGDKWVDALVAYLSENIDYMDNFFKERMPEVKLIRPEGLYLTWVDFGALGMDHDELEKFMLTKAKLWLDEGYIFGFGGAGYERFNVAMPKSLLIESLERLASAVDSLKTTKKKEKVAKKGKKSYENATSQSLPA